MDNERPIYRCPHCNKCIAVKIECKKYVLVTPVKNVTTGKTDFLCTIERKCQSCKEKFFVELSLQ